MSQCWLVDQTEWRAPCPHVMSANRNHYSWWCSSSPAGVLSLLSWSCVHAAGPQIFSLHEIRFSKAAFVWSVFLLGLHHYKCVWKCVRAFLPFLTDISPVVSNSEVLQWSESVTWNHRIFQVEKDPLRIIVSDPWLHMGPPDDLSKTVLPEPLGVWAFTSLGVYRHQYVCLHVCICFSL